MIKTGVACSVVSLLSLCSCGREHAALNPPTAVVQTMHREISNAINLGDGDYQTKALRQKVVANPANLPARLQLADRYRKTGAPELAIEHLRSAAERYPEDAHVAMLLAIALRDFGRLDDAMSALVNYCNRNPNPPVDLLSLSGILKDQAGQFAEAETTYRAAIQQAPKRADLYNNLGYNLMLQDKPKEAVDAFQQALQIEPRSEFANNNIALALLAQWKDDKQPKDALLHWQSVSDPATAHNNLATVLIEQQRYQEARKELEVALSYRKDHPAALANLKLVAELDGKPVLPGRQPHNSFWKRVKTVFTTTSPAPAVQTATK